jgi:hypothetical protein
MWVPGWEGASTLKRASSKPGFWSFPRRICRVFAEPILRRSQLILGMTGGFALLGGPASATTEGALGATSTGKISISVSVASHSQVSGLSDVALSPAGLVSNAQDTQNICVWLNTANKGYRIIASGSGPERSFTLANGSMSAPYSVAWSGSPDQTSASFLKPGETVRGLRSAATQPGCKSGSATMSLLTVRMAPVDKRITDANLTYTGTLNLLLAPE